MNEHSFRNTFRRLALKFDPDVHIWKINDGYEGGAPDFFLETKTQERWVEIKYTRHLPKRDTTIIQFTKRPYLSELQQLWLNRRWSRFNDAFFVLGLGDDRCENCLVLANGEWNNPLSVFDINQRLVKPNDMMNRIFN